MGAKYEDMADHQLIKQFLKGNEFAFETLYARYKKSLYGFLNNLIKNQAEKSKSSPLFVGFCAKITKEKSVFKNTTVNCDIFDKNAFYRLTFSSIYDIITRI